MWVPNGFIPSSANRRLTYDEEGRLLEFNISRQATGGLGDTNSRFATEAERFDSITPFMAMNKQKDAHRRNYVIQPGGACLYFEQDKPLKDPYGGGMVQYTAPPDSESFGHDSLDGTKMAGPAGREFTVGERSDR